MTDSILVDLAALARKARDDASARGWYDSTKKGSWRMLAADPMLDHGPSGRAFVSARSPDAILRIEAAVRRVIETSTWHADDCDDEECVALRALAALLEEKRDG